MKALIITKILKVLVLICLLVNVGILIFGPKLTTDETIPKIVVSVALFLNYISLSICEENRRRLL